MSQLWLANADGAAWAVSPLDRNVYGLSCSGLSAAEAPAESNGNGAPAVLLMRHVNGSREQWFLLAHNRADVRVNGLPLVIGACLLLDRDGITMRDDAGHAFRCFYSAERLAQAVPYPGPDAVRCPRCKQPIAPGQMAVQCPGPDCGGWHHLTAELPCWIYSTTCALCDQATQLDAGFHWTPEDL